MKVTKEMTAKVRTGDPIPDDELTALVRHYRTLESLLEVMPADYGLALRDVRQTSHMLEDFQRARKRS